ncbi:hypothetical protein [Mycobacterium sp. IS-1590]|uniref:hypothetical protein n=1 Tax=Mycobacterium sp. IS-1590 TaxID=1772286 RepID=UPI0012E38A90|nr:hypothetical protein [Mycobacterium sp. IS-1590]
MAAAACLVAGLLTAGRFVVNGAASGGEYVLGFVFGLSLYGPALIWAAWPVAVPGIAVVGVALAFAGRRSRIVQSRLTQNRGVRIAKAILLVYAAVLVVSWLVWLLGAR